MYLGNHRKGLYAELIGLREANRPVTMQRSQTNVYFKSEHREEVLTSRHPPMVPLGSLSAPDACLIGLEPETVAGYLPERGNQGVAFSQVVSLLKVD